jgi:hypothetical protein
MQIQCHIVLYLPDYHVNTHRVCSTFGYCRSGGFLAQKFNRSTARSNLHKSFIEARQPPLRQYLVQATPPVSDIQQSTLITFFIYYLTVKIE